MARVLVRMWTICFNMSIVITMCFIRADHDEDLSDADFLLVSCIFVGCNVLFALLRSVLFAYGGLRAAENLYRRLTASTLHTYLYFFETQTLGRLLNRFGKDTNVIDDDLPFMLNIVLAQVQWQ